MRDARGASDLMMNFLAISGWEWERGSEGAGEREMRRNSFCPRARSPALSLPRSPALSLLRFPQFDYRRVFDVGDGAVIFAEQSQVDHDQFVATAFVKIDHSPAQRQPLAVSRQSVMPRVARCVNPRAQRDVAHQNLVGLRDPESRMADGIVNRRSLGDIVEEHLHSALQVQVEFKRSQRVAD